MEDGGKLSSEEIAQKGCVTFDGGFFVCLAHVNTIEKIHEKNRDREKTGNLTLHQWERRAQQPSNTLDLDRHRTKQNS